MEFAEEQMWYFPDDDPYNLQFEMLEIETVYFLQNLGFLFWIIMAHGAFVILHALIYKLRSSCSCASKVVAKIGNYLYWNGVFRLYMEVYFDITLLSLLNMHMLDWQTEFVAIQASNVISVVTLALISVVPVYFFVFYLKKLDKWGDEGFKKNYSSVLEGTRSLSKEKKLLVIPMAFFARRLLFVVTVIWF